MQDRRWAPGESSSSAAASSRSTASSPSSTPSSTGSTTRPRAVSSADAQYPVFVPSTRGSSLLTLLPFSSLLTTLLPCPRHARACHFDPTTRTPRSAPPPPPRPAPRGRGQAERRQGHHQDPPRGRAARLQALICIMRVSIPFHAPSCTTVLYCSRFFTQKDLSVSIVHLLVCKRARAMRAAISWCCLTPRVHMSKEESQERERAH